MNNGKRRGSASALPLAEPAPMEGDKGGSETGPSNDYLMKQLAELEEENENLCNQVQLLESRLRDGGLSGIAQRGNQSQPVSFTGIARGPTEVDSQPIARLRTSRRGTSPEELDTQLKEMAAENEEVHDRLREMEDERQREQDKSQLADEELRKAREKILKLEKENLDLQSSNTRLQRLADEHDMTPTTRSERVHSAAAERARKRAESGRTPNMASSFMTSVGQSDGSGEGEEDLLMRVEVAEMEAYECQQELEEAQEHLRKLQDAYNSLSTECEELRLLHQQVSHELARKNNMLDEQMLASPLSEHRAGDGERLDQIRCQLEASGSESEELHREAERGAAEASAKRIKELEAKLERANKAVAEAREAHQKDLEEMQAQWEIDRKNAVEEGYRAATQDLGQADEASPEESAAAVRIQAGVRRRAAQQEAAVRRKEVQQGSAATRIQAAVRRRAAQQEARRRRASDQEESDGDWELGENEIIEALNEALAAAREEARAAKSALAVAKFTEAEARLRAAAIPGYKATIKDLEDRLRKVSMKLGEVEQPAWWNFWGLNCTARKEPEAYHSPAPASTLQLQQPAKSAKD